MDFFSEMRAALDALQTLLGEDVEATGIPAVVQRLTDEGVVALIESATVLVRGAESVRIAGSGVVAARSSRDAGHGGLAQKRGHRSPVSLIQDLTGSTRADAAKQVRLGEALAAGLAGADSGSMDETEETDAEIAAPARSLRPWHAVLGDALMAGALTSAQHDAIYRGLCEPPAPADEDSGADVLAAWAIAAAQLVDEASRRTVEELSSAARTIRDLLDPAGAQRRFEERSEGRSFRTWTDRDGIKRGSFAFDDDGGAWVDTIVDTALRPRRGGPRFVDPDEAAHAKTIVDDPRTNDQLAYDLIMDVLRAGALADAKTVFGTRQAGIRIVTTTAAFDDAVGGRPSVAILEDSGTTIPGWVVGQRACDTATTPVNYDEHLNPLDLGREARLFSAKQRLTLAIRDGGCRIPACDRPASYCEAHHIDPYAEGGCTDIDRGILLCRFHHMNMHHHGWWITRDGTGDFVLHKPGEPPMVLPTRLARRYAFGDLQPPPRRFRPAA